MMSKHAQPLWALAATTLVLLVAGFQASHGEEDQGRGLGGPPGQRQGLGGRDCVSCHKDFADKYLRMKNVHAVVEGTAVRGMPPASRPGRTAGPEA